MINKNNLLSTSSTYDTDELTYVNEAQLILFNHKITNICQNHNYNDSNIGKMNSCFNTREINECHMYGTMDEMHAAVIIQRAYRRFRQRQSSLHSLKRNNLETSNYIDFWGDCKVSGQSSGSLITTSNSASDSKNSCDCENQDQYDDHYVYNEAKYRDNETYESFPFELTSSNFNNNRQIVRELFQDHHSQCLLSKQRQHSVDLIRLNSVPGMYFHHKNVQYITPSYVIFNDDLRKDQLNMNMAHSHERQSISTAMDHNCVKHKVFRSNSLLSSNYSRFISVNNNHLQDTEYNSKTTKEIQRCYLLRKQSKLIQNQRIVTAKRMYRVGLNVFNKNPALGINYLIKCKHIKDHPSDIAKFLLTKSGISIHSIGVYLGSINDPFALQVTKCFLRRIYMENKEVDEALRSFIHYVHLPGESQKISHLMQEFKGAYIHQNKSRTSFKSQETVMILAYAIIMLQTDAHNQSIRKNEKMTLEQFVYNLRGVDANSDIDRNILENIYTRITSREMKTKPDHTDKVRQLNDVIFGSIKPNNFIDRTRRFMCYCRLSEIKKDMKNKSDSHQREVFLFNDILLITKAHNKSRKDDVQYHCKYSLTLVDLRVELFSTTNHNFGIQLLDRKTNNSILKFNAQCELDQRKFMFDLTDCIFESLEMVKINFAEDLSAKKVLINKASLVNSHEFGDLIPNLPRRQELCRIEEPDVLR